MTPKELTAHYGNQALAGIAVGVDQSTISDWVRAEKIPDKRQLQIERDTKGVLKADSGCFERVTGIRVSPAKVARLLSEAAKA